MGLDILERLRQAVLDGDETIVRETTQEAIEKGIDPVEIAEKGLIAGIRVVGEKFERMEVFLTGMMLSAEAMRAGMNVVVSRLPKGSSIKRGTVVLGTVKGDVHEIGKNIFGALLTASGFDVHDLGSDVPASAFVRKAREVDADLIGASALMTTTLPGQKDIVEYLRSLGARDKHIVLVGGAPASAEWAQEIGADGYAETAVAGVELALKTIERKKHHEN
jgi:trimethylamine corrinoid protein